MFILQLIFNCSIWKLISCSHDCFFWISYELDPATNYFYSFLMEMFSAWQITTLVSSLFLSNFTVSYFLFLTQFFSEFFVLPMCLIYHFLYVDHFYKIIKEDIQYNPPSPPAPPICMRYRDHQLILRRKLSSVSSFEFDPSISQVMAL